jgi:hypothetical protein
LIQAQRDPINPALGGACSARCQCCYSLFVERKRIKDIALKSLVAIVLAMLFVSLLAQ